MSQFGSSRLAVSFVVGFPVVALAATLQVSNTGLDGPTCGLAAPCRSITQGITNAASGDTIIVGPGVYGTDLNHDGIDGNDPGEEPFGGIVITKPVQLFSKLGASSTTVQTSFFIQVDGVMVGKLGSGFTIEPPASGGNAVLISSLVPFGRISNVRIAGNVMVMDAPTLTAFAAGGTDGGLFEDNRVMGLCLVGFFMADSTDTITRNVVMGCTEGFHIIGLLNPGPPAVHVVRNTAVGNTVPGVALDPGVGFHLEGNVAEFSGNVAIGNATGASVLNPIPTFRNNTFAGNLTNCGVSNGSGTTVAAANNYWGAPTGPGADPADAVCDGPGSTTVTTPFLTTDPTRAQSALR